MCEREGDRECVCEREDKIMTIVGVCLNRVHVLEGDNKIKWRIKK